MFKKIRKYLLLIPCMIMAFFLMGNSDVSANEAKLLDASSVTVGGNSKENLYYFSNSNVWEFKIEDYNKWDDTFLKYRVVRADGVATGWQGSVKDTRYVDNNGKFTITLDQLTFFDNIGLEGRNSVAPLATYYVDIQYYSHFIFDFHLEEKDETVKIVTGGTNGSFYTPTIQIAYEEASDKFTISAEMSENGQGTGIITAVYYFFSETEVQNVDLTSFIHEIDVSPNYKVKVGLDGVDKKYKHLYVMVESGNGYGRFEKYDIDRQVQDPTPQPNNPTPPPVDNEPEDPEKSTGLFDHEFGDIILIVLIIVLIVSCALIITQKIVDYKKRLY